MMSDSNYDIDMEAYSEPLTDWENEPRCEDLKGDLQEATPHHHAHITEVSNWLDYLNVRGSAKHPKKKGRSAVTPKLIRKQAEWRYAALSEPFLSAEKMFKTAPYTWEDKERSEQAGLVLNSQWNNSIDKTAFIDEYVRAAVDEGSVVVKVGWKFEEGEVRRPRYVTKEVTNPQQAEALIEMATKAVSEPGFLESLPQDAQEDVRATIDSGVPSMRVQQGVETVNDVIANHPTAEVLEYNTVIVDPSCKGNLRNANFVIHQFETSRSELEKTGLYKNLDKIDVQKSSITQVGEISSEENTEGFNFKDEPRKKFIAYEYWGYWDIDGTGVVQPIVATWVGDVMIRMEKSPFPDQGLPFVLVQYLPRRKHVYGQPDGELLKENQDIVGAVTRGMLDHMGRSAVGQKGVMKGALDVTNQRRFDAGDDYSFNNNVDPRMAFFSHTYPELPSSAPFMVEMQNQEAEALTGVKAFHGGISGEGLGRSATAARSAMDAASKREMGILRRLANGIIEIGRKHMAMNALFLDEDTVVRITNDSFIRVNGDDLAGRTDITLDISTAETDNAKAEELAFMLQTMGQSMPFEMTQKVLVDIAKLRKMPELAHSLEQFQPPEPDPLDRALKSAELALKEAEIKKLESEAIENQAEAMASQAKARKENSQADKLDLDYVEQELGVTAARDQEKIKAQAESQGRLKLLEKELENEPTFNPDGGNA
jgi:hypothetical protein